MKVILDLCIVPIGVGVSLSPYAAACEKVLQEAGLEAFTVIVLRLVHPKNAPYPMLLKMVSRP